MLTQRMIKIGDARVWKLPSIGQNTSFKIRGTATLQSLLLHRVYLDSGRNMISAVPLTVTQHLQARLGYHCRFPACLTAVPRAIWTKWAAS